MLGRITAGCCAPRHRHALVAFGPPQSGKSAGLAVPALLEWGGPAVASSIKTDLLAATERRRRALGEVFVFDPFGLAGGGGHTWSPLRAARTWDGALETAWRLAAAGELDSAGSRAATSGRWRPSSAWRRCSTSPPPRSSTWTPSCGGPTARAAGSSMQRIAALTGTALGAEQLEGAHAAYDALRAFEAQADRTRTSIEATAQGLLRAYRFRRVLASARSCQIDPDTLLDGRTRCI